MANFGKALKRASKAFADSTGPGNYAAAGKKITCPHCKATIFAEGSALLNTFAMSLMDIDWADNSATTLACINCGYIQWFLKRPERI